MEPNNRENGTHNLQNLIGEIPLENNFSKFQNENHAKETKLSNSRRFSQREMESLSAICDTYLPSIEMPLENNTTVDESTKEFYQTSASMVGTPYHMEWLIKERLQHPKLFLSKLSFLLLSTWIGTFILCGRRSLSNHFPYFQKFSQIPQKRREEILLSWSQSYFSLLRILFLGTKYLTLLSFFTQINQKNENISWEAIGYCGPDPKRYPHEIKNQNTEHHKNKKVLHGPLVTGIINLNPPNPTSIHRLLNLGFTISFPPLNQIKAEPKQPSFTIKCDVVVVGSGCGGGVVAGTLAKAGYKVLVLEKGSYLARNNLTLLEGDAMNKMYLGNGLLATKDMDVVMLAGSTVGGGSTINWGASIKTPNHVLREWEEKYNLEMFGSKKYREAMDVVCNKMGIHSGVDKEGFNSMVLRKGCQELGYPVENVPTNAPPDHYCGWCCLGCKDGRKKGTSETWLVDLVDSGNGVILPNCEAITVLQKQNSQAKKSASGVVFRFQSEQGRNEVCLVESMVTIVACGALSTPELLKRSGLKNPNIGKNLHLHPVAMAWGYFPDTISTGSWPDPEKKSYEGSMMTSMSKVVAEFESSGYGAIIQTPSLHPGMFSLLMPWRSGTDIKNRMCKFARTAQVFALARDKGSGDVASSTTVGYKMDSIDEHNLKKGIEKVLRIMVAAGAEEIGTHHQSGKVLNVKASTPSELESFLREESSRGFTDLSWPICSAHQMGSCRMGIDEKTSVVNPMGETWEVEGLYVADSSVFPTALGVNPMVTIQAIAYCTAQAILEDLGRKLTK
ncbi:hypothetical protein Leryth_010880 [Lithospermum erythrorhizon]|nr:hypothetical protein Leryth_010880 [Lithospermum erythrorhizon]